MDDTPVVLSPKQIRQSKPVQRGCLFVGTDGRPLVFDRDYAMLFGERGRGKTLFALGLAMGLAGGVEFGGFVPPASRRVLFVDGEMTLSDMDDRIRRMMAGFPKGCQDAIEQNLRVLSWESQALGIPTLSEEPGREFVDKAIAEFDPALVFLDNISCLAGDIPESGPGAETAWHPLGKWGVGHRTKRTVVWVHHAGRNGSARGISKREDPLNWVLKLRTAGNQTKGAYFTLEYAKLRGRPQAAPWSILIADNREKGALEWSIRSGVAAIEDRMTDKIGRALDFAKASLKAAPTKTGRRAYIRDGFREAFNGEGLATALIDRAIEQALEAEEQEG